MFIRIFFLLLFVASNNVLHAQLHILHNGRSLVASEQKIEYAFDKNCTLIENEVTNIHTLSWKKAKSSLSEISYAPYCTYLRIELSSLKKYGIVNWLAIENPHINRLKIWIVQNDSIAYAAPLTGDALPFQSRILPSRNYLYNLNNVSDRAKVIIAVDKRFTKLELPIHFQDNVYFINHFDRDLKGILFFLGFIFFLFLFNAYLLVSTKESVFGFYLFYLAMVALYICIDAGFLFKLLYPDYPELNDIIRPATYALSIVPMMLFFNRILSIKQSMPRLFRLNEILCALYFLLFVIATVHTAITTDPFVQNAWLNANRVITPLIMLVLFTESFYFIYKGNTLAFFLLVSYLSLIFFALVYIALQINLLQASLFTTYSLYWGLSADAIFMGLSLAWRFRLYKEHLIKLQVEKESIQELLTIEIANWKEQQMTQFSSLLHDRIGGLIGILRLSVDNMVLTDDGRTQISKQIVSIADEIRQYSHSFSPTALKLKGVKASVIDLVDNIRENSKINIQFEWMGQDHIEPNQLEIIIYFFLQEMLHNMIKHSSCSQAILQIINENQSVYIYLEDNGKGCDHINYDNGIGLKSMQKIVELLNGRFHVSSTKNEGFTISIELSK